MISLFEAHHTLYAAHVDGVRRVYVYNGKGAGIARFDLTAVERAAWTAALAAIA